MNFLSKTFQGIKSLLGILAAVASAGISVYGGVIVAGGVTSGWAFVAGGILCFIPAIFSLYDASKILNDIKREFA